LQAALDQLRPSQLLEDLLTRVERERIYALAGSARERRSAVTLSTKLGTLRGKFTSARDEATRLRERAAYLEGALATASSTERRLLTRLAATKVEVDLVRRAADEQRELADQLRKDLGRQVRAYKRLRHRRIVRFSLAAAGVARPAFRVVRRLRNGMATTETCSPAATRSDTRKL
jgi:hypothetical protein